METITEAKPTRVMGIGVGLFLLIFLGAIALLMCLVGSATARPGLFYATSIIIYSVLLIVLLTAEKEPRYVSNEGDIIVEGYNSHYYPRLTVFIMLLFFTLISLWSACKLALVQQLYYAHPATQALVAEMIATEMEPNNGKLHPKIKSLPSFPHLDAHRQVARSVAPYRGRNIATPPDQSLENDVNAWRQSVTTAASQLEDERIRLLNLELLSRFGGTKHLSMNEKVLVPLLQATKDQIQKVHGETEAVNVERRRKQEEVAEELIRAKRTRYMLADKNMELEVATSYVAAEIHNLKEERSEVLSPCIKTEKEEEHLDFNSSTTTQ